MARAKSLLERAAASGHLPAVYHLVELLDREGAVDKAIDLLKVLFRGLRLLELDALGGSGSRGYGKLRFQHLKLDGEAIQDAFEGQDPFEQ